MHVEATKAANIKHVLERPAVKFYYWDTACAAHLGAPSSPESYFVSLQKQLENSCLAWKIAGHALKLDVVALAWAGIPKHEIEFLEHAVTVFMPAWRRSGPSEVHITAAS